MLLLQEAVANHDAWLKAHRHVRYMWIPHTDAVVVVALDEAEPGAPPPAGPPAADDAARCAPLQALVPAALVAARVLVSQASTRKASKILKETWVLSPHPELADVQANLIPGDTPEARLDRVRELLKEDKLRDGGGGIESAVALARAASRAKRWDMARDALKPYAEDRPQARVCALMADIEEAEGDKGRAREWLSRALTAPRDPIWVSDGVASPRWTPVSPVSGEIVPCEWKAPFEMPEQLEADRPALAAAIDTAKPALDAPPRSLEPPRMVQPQRAPDDPGLPEDFDTPTGRTLPAEG